MLRFANRRERDEFDGNRATLALTLSTLGTYLDRQGFDRAGLLVLFDETGLTVAGRCAAARGAWVMRAMPLVDLAVVAARRAGLLLLGRPPRFAPLLRALGALLDERCYLRRGLTLQFGQGVVLVGGLALIDGGISTPYGHESTLTLVLDDGDLGPYLAEG